MSHNLDLILMLNGGLGAVSRARAAESFQFARREADRLLRRQRLLSMTCYAGLVLLSMRAIAALLFPTLNPGGSAVLLAIPLGLGLVAALVGLGVARRWQSRLADLRQDIFWLEFVLTAVEHESIPTVLMHPYRGEHEGQAAPVVLVRRPDLFRWERSAQEPAPPHRRLSGAPWRTALAVATALVAVLLLAVSFGEPRDTLSSERLRWTFMEPTPNVGDLGLVTPVERAGMWQLEDHEHATGGRALVNHAGDASEGPALALTSAQPRDVRVTTRCKVEAKGTACGLVFRFHDGANYYVADVNAASGRVSLAVVAVGSERTIQQLPAEIKGGVWQELAVEARSDNILVFWNGKKVIDVHDVALPNPGGVGLWVPSTDVAFFDELTVELLPSSTPPVELFPFLLRKRT